MSDGTPTTAGASRFRVAVPFEHHEIFTSEVKLHYAQVGHDLRPMILLHGIGMDWRVWQALSRRLAPHFTLYLFDLRGHGSSDKPEHGYSLSHYAADVEDALEAMGLSDTVLVGSSLGGMVAAAVEAPVDVVSHRILVDPPMTGGPVRDPEMFREILRLKRRSVDELGDYLTLWNPGVGRHLLRMMAEMWMEASDGVIEDMLDHPADYFDVFPSMRHTESPTLLAQADPTMGGVLSDAFAEAALRVLPKGFVQKFEGAGHAVHAYRPVEFTEAVLQFTGAE